MRAKPISFAQVIKSKGRNTFDSQLHSEPQHASLSSLMEQFGEFPEEDYTLYLAPVSKSKPTSFRAMTSRANSNEGEVFDSWIQKQSMVSNKENVRLITSKNYLQPLKEEKTKMATSRGRQNRETLKSVADLHNKMERPQSNNLYFKSNSRTHIQKYQGQDQPKVIQRAIRQNQQTSLRSSENIEINIAGPIKLPQKINVQPYIQQKTTVKHPKRKENINDLIAAAEDIHIEIAELAHKYIDEEDQLNEQRQDSLLIESTEQKEETKKQKNAPFINAEDENEIRWQTAKNKVNSYLQKISQQQTRTKAIPQKTQFTTPIMHHNNQASKDTQQLDHPGYSFAINENDYKTDNYRIPLETINIPQIQEIKSQRLPFESNHNYISLNHLQDSEAPIPINSRIPSTESVKYEVTPKDSKKEENLCSPEMEMSAKRISSSLVFSSNPKDTPSPQAKVQQQEGSSSGQQHVTLSFTEKKPEIFINIPLNYAEAADQFQLQAVEVRHERIDEHYNCQSSPSPNQEKWQTEMIKNQEVIRTLPKEPKKEGNSPSDGESNSYEIQKQKVVGQVQEENMKIEQKQLQQTTPEQLINTIPPIQISHPIPFINNEVIVVSKAQDNSINRNSTKEFRNDQLSPSVAHLSHEKISIQQVNAEAQPEMSITPDAFNIAVPALPVIEPKKNEEKSSSSKGSSKGSPSLFGLKKIYSSPKTNPILSQPPIITSAFTTVAQHKPTNVEPVHTKPSPIILKSFERPAKIETFAYISNYAKKPKEEPKVMIEEDNQEFQFDF